MIDYNLNPSFIITAKETEDIMYTNARDWFSTSYESFHPIIQEINGFVVPTLELIKGKTMIDRKVVEFEDNSLGLYINTYATVNDGVTANDKVVLAINYFDHDVVYNGKVIPAQSAVEIE